MTNIIKRSLWNRLLPVSIRHNERLIFGSVFVLVVTGFIVGTFQIRPIVFSSDGPLEISNVNQNIEGMVDIFDTNVPHSIELIVSDIEYQQMIYDFQVLTEKSWIQADATIDGVFIPSVGIRLKGNSTLLGLVPGGAPPGMEPLTGNASFESPSTLPLLLSFNEYFEGRAYQGRQELAIRPAQEGGSSLNEALALQLIADSRQLSQKYTWAEFRVNDSPSATRLILENPDQQYAFSLGLGRGVLYKSTSDNLFIYKGEDTTKYVEDYSQLNAIGSRDISPIINLLEWLENASDEEFNKELTDWIDVPVFARYVATQKLLGNFDDMAGPGRNFLLWYGLDNEKFKIITWDMNLAIAGNLFGKIFGEMMPTEGMPVSPPVMEDMNEQVPISDGEPAMPLEPPSVDMALMIEVLSAEGMPDLGSLAELSRSMGLPLVWGNNLKDRFVASDFFADEVANAESELSALWTAEYALQLIDQLSPSVPASDGLSEEQIALDIEGLKQIISVML